MDLQSGRSRRNGDRRVSRGRGVVGRQDRWSASLLLVGSLTIFGFGRTTARTYEDLATCFAAGFVGANRPGRCVRWRLSASGTYTCSTSESDAPPASHDRARGPLG